jgi:hypothetical protein
VCQGATSYPRAGHVISACFVAHLLFSTCRVSSLVDLLLILICLGRLDDHKRQFGHFINNKWFVPEGLHGTRRCWLMFVTRTQVHSECLPRNTTSSL